MRRMVLAAVVVLLIGLTSCGKSKEEIKKTAVESVTETVSEDKPELSEDTENVKEKESDESSVPEESEIV